MGTGRFELFVSVAGTPQVPRVSVASAGAPVADRTFTPQYTVSRPNGPDCEPECRQWTGTWTLP